MLIREDLKAHKLSDALNRFGCTDNPRLPYLTDLALITAGFKDISSELYDFYFRLQDKHIRQLTDEPESLTKAVVEIYGELRAKRKKMSMPGKV